MTRRSAFILLVILIGALAVRAPLMPSRGYVGDMSWWIYWGKKAADMGPVHMVDRVKCDYPPAYVYILMSLHKAFSSLAPETEAISSPDLPESELLRVSYHPHFWRIIYKIPGVVADLLCGLLLFFFLRKRVNEKRSLVFMAAYVFNPAVIYVSAVWGQVDSLFTLFVFASVWSLIEKKWFTCGVFFAVAIMLKLQAIVAFPVVFFYALRGGGRKAVFEAGSAALAVCFLLLLPFLIKGRMDLVTGIYFSLVGQYPYWSLYGFNLWWILGLGDARSLFDTAYLGGLIQAKTLGLVLLTTFTAAISLRILREKHARSENILFASLGLALAFYCLPTQIHERYLFMALIFLCALAAFRKDALWLYGLVSLGFLFCLTGTIMATYPDQSVPFVKEAFAYFPLTAGLCALNIGVMLWAVARFVSRDVKVYAAASVLFIALLSFHALSFSRMASRPVNLAGLQPTTVSQQWGNMNMNRSVSNKRLWIGGLPFRTGLGTHARSEIRYHLPPGVFGRLEGYCGKDDRPLHFDNKVIFSIWDQGRRKLYDSGVLQGWTYPRRFSVDMEGVDELFLIVDDGGDGINFDHADWADLILVPKGR